MIYRICLLLLFAFCTVSLAEPTYKRRGGSQAFFKTKDIINYEKGSFEAWFKPDFDAKDNYQPDIEYSVGSFYLFQLHDNKGNAIGGKAEGLPYLRVVVNDGKKGQHLAFATNFGYRLTQKGTRMPLVLIYSFESLGWDKSDWHYVAIRWQRSGEDMKISFTCDKKTEEFSCKYNKYMMIEDQLLSFGDLAVGEGSIDSVRLSSEYLSDEEITKSFAKGFKQDKKTTLFHSGKSLLKLKKGKFYPRFGGLIANRKATKKLKINSKGSLYTRQKLTLIDGKFNKAWMVHRDEERKLKK